MAKVLSFKDAKLFRDARNQVWGDFDVNIDWADVTVHSETGDAASTDPVMLGARTADKVAKLFTACGLPPTPVTWGELRHNFDYCQHLIVLASGLRFGVSLDEVVATAESVKTGWGARMRAFGEGDLETLTRLHEEADVFRRNGLRTDDKLSSAI